MDSLSDGRTGTFPYIECVFPKSFEGVTSRKAENRALRAPRMAARTKQARPVSQRVLLSSWSMPQLDRGDPFIAEAVVGFLALMV